MFFDNTRCVCTLGPNIQNMEYNLLFLIPMEHKNMKWLLVTYLFLGFVSQQSYAFECQSYLPKASITTLYTNLKYLVNSHTRADSLTAKQRAVIQATIQELRKIPDQFNQSYNNKFKPYGTSFLADLRELFQDEENSLRNKNQHLINELERFLDHGGDLIFRQLDILPHIRSITQTWALAYIDQPENVYFNLNYFISSQLRDGRILNGYVFSKEEHEALKAPVFVYDQSKQRENKSEELNYPGSAVVVPTIPNLNLAFPGLPLLPDLMSFLKEHGNEKGRLRVAAQRYNKKSSSLIPSLLGVKELLPVLDSRWSNTRNNYFIIKNENGTLNEALSNLKNYHEVNGHLVIPTLPVYWEEKPKSILNLNEDKRKIHLVMTASDNAAFTVAPTSFEFIIAFIELVQM
jgi:hypothetical protein